MYVLVERGRPRASAQYKAQAACKEDPYQQRQVEASVAAGEEDDASSRNRGPSFSRYIHLFSYGQ